MSIPTYGPEGGHYQTPAPVYPRAVPPPTSVPPAPPASVPPAPPTVVPPDSGAPTYAYPLPSGPPGPAGAPGSVLPPVSRNTLIAGLLCLALLVLAGVGFGLYLNERATLGDTRGQLNEQRDTVAARDTALAEAQRRANDLAATLKTTEENLGDTTEERDVLLPCMRRVQEIFDALRTDDDNKLGTALQQAEDACGKAEARVDS